MTNEIIKVKYLGNNEQLQEANKAFINTVMCL